VPFVRDGDAIASRLASDLIRKSWRHGYVRGSYRRFLKTWGLGPLLETKSFGERWSHSGLLLPVIHDS
jgi:hypothetical protein